MTTTPNPKPPARRWTHDTLRSARSNLNARITQILGYSHDQIRAELRAALGFAPDTTVSHEAVQRWLISVAIDQHFPDSPPAL